MGHGKSKKFFIFQERELLYILGWNFIALRLTNFWREVPSSYFFYIYFGKWNVLSPRLNKFLFQSELSKPTLIALSLEKRNSYNNPEKWFKKFLMFWLWLYYFTSAKCSYKSGSILFIIHMNYKATLRGSKQRRL